MHSESNGSILDRREFLKNAAVAAVAATVIPGTLHGQTPVPVLTQVPLPFAKNALQPCISERTLTMHYDHHHKAYVDAVNAAMKNLGRSYTSFEEAIKATSNGVNIEQDLFQNAVLAWNHDLYWQGMKPAGGGQPKGPLLKALLETYGTYEKFVEAFITAGSRIGVGWVWLVVVKGKFAVQRTDYFDTPILMGAKALITMDVWEHAYYLDYQYNRAGYMDAYLQHLVNWDFAQKRFA